jgi:hypothetical protein
LVDQQRLEKIGEHTRLLTLDLWVFSGLFGLWICKWFLGLIYILTFRVIYAQLIFDLNQICQMR